ncbi:MAG: hypothetical protein Q4E53_06325 [Eubacteriales bacterium]|nr:hypothetical protein [Eubacteriales bacterium]
MKRRKIILILMCFISAIFLASCEKKKKDEKVKEAYEASTDVAKHEEDIIMLIDYCKRTLATVGGDGYDETVLYQKKDGSCELHYYSKYEGDEVEAHSAYSVDQAVIEEAFDIIEKNKISNWNDEYDNIGLDGGEYILKFRTEDGGYIRATSNNMPENGISIMSSVAHCLDRYVDKENKIE